MVATVGQARPRRAVGQAHRRHEGGRWQLLFLSHGRGNRGLTLLSQFFKATELLCGRTEVQTQRCLIPKSACLPPRHQLPPYGPALGRGV